MNFNKHIVFNYLKVMCIFWDTLYIMMTIIINYDIYIYMPYLHSLHITSFHVVNQNFFDNANVVFHAEHLNHFSSIHSI